MKTFIFLVGIQCATLSQQCSARRQASGHGAQTFNMCDSSGTKVLFCDNRKSTSNPPAGIEVASTWETCNTKQKCYQFGSRTARCGNKTPCAGNSGVNLKCFMGDGITFLCKGGAATISNICTIYPTSRGTCSIRKNPSSGAFYGECATRTWPIEWYTYSDD